MARKSTKVTNQLDNTSTTNSASESIHPDALIAPEAPKRARTRVRSIAKAIKTKILHQPDAEVQIRKPQSEPEFTSELAVEPAVTLDSIGSVTFRKRAQPSTKSNPTREKKAPALKAETSPLPVENPNGDLVVMAWRTSTAEPQKQTKRESRTPVPDLVKSPDKSNSEELSTTFRKKQNSPTTKLVEAPAVTREILSTQTFGGEWVVSFRAKSEESIPNRTKRERPVKNFEIVDNNELFDDFDQSEPELVKIKLEPEIPLVPVRPSISTPVEAPQVVMRDGTPTIVHNHDVIPPFFFAAGEIDDKSVTVVADEMKLAGEAGVHVHQIVVTVGPGAVELTREIPILEGFLQKFISADPLAKFIFQLKVEHSRNWDVEFPEAKQSAHNLRFVPSLCDDGYWQVVADSISEFVNAIQKTKFGPKIIGMHLGRELWMRKESDGYDDSKAAAKQFRLWARKRYSNDVVTLRAAWFDGRARFDNLEIPKFQPEGVEGDRFVRISRKQRPLVDYHLFLSDATVQRISDLAYAVKAASGGNLLVGVSYGFTLEWSHPSSGHLALGKLLRTAEVDFITGPSSYRSRLPGGAAPFTCPIDSIALNGKLFLFEEDYKTSLSGRTEEDDSNPVLRTPQSLESAQWRGAGAALAHRAGLVWTDASSQGWLKTPGIWRRASEIMDALLKRMAATVKDPEVIIFVDERALSYLVDQAAFVLLVQNVSESVLRSGLNAGFYLLSDLAHREKFPEAKLYIFLNAWDVRPELRAAIKTRLQKDKKVLFWLYAAGLLDSGRESLERTREVTGIALKPQPFHSKSGSELVNKRHPLTNAFPDRGLIGGAQLEPSYFAIYDEGQEELGQYSQSGLSSFVARTFHGANSEAETWTSVFLGEPIVTPAFIRALGQLAQCQVYDFHEDTVHVSPPFFTANASSGGNRMLTLPSNWVVYNVLDRKLETMEASSLRTVVLDGSSRVYYIGTREEVDALVEAKPASVLRMETYPPSYHNDLTGRNPDFDIPIMRLGEWMEGDDNEEVKEEWLLRPRITDFEEISASEGDADEIGNEFSRGRRRSNRNQRGRKDNFRGKDNFQASRPIEAGTPEAEVGVGVMFRKRV